MEAKQKENEPKKPKNSAFRIGIIVDDNFKNIAYYNDQFRKINKCYKHRVELLFIGGNPENKKFSKAVEGVDYKYVKPVSLVHFYKQYSANEIDLLFIPLIKSNQNYISEDFNKFTDAGLFKIPSMVVNIYPYNKIITNDLDGFVYNDKVDFYEYLKDLLLNRLAIVKLCGNNAYEKTLKQFNYSPEHIERLSEVFS